MKTELPRTITRLSQMSTKERKKSRKPIRDGIRKQKKKKRKRKTRDSEYQTLKSRGKGCK